LSVPRFRSRITFSTFFDAFFPYFAIQDLLPTIHANSSPTRA
jgi:hypothetical protein